MGNDIYIVAKLLKKRKHEGKIEYLVQWFGCSKDKNSWEPESHILDKNLIKEFDAERVAATQVAPDVLTRRR